MTIMLGNLITVCEEWRGRKSDIPFYLITQDPRKTCEADEDTINIIDFHQDYCGVVIEVGEYWYGDSKYELIKLVLPAGAGYLTAPQLCDYVKVLQ